MQHSLTGTATAYCINGITSTGTKTCMGTIAVNPKVIPYNKKLHVSWNGGSYDGVSRDTGGDLMKNKILVDLWFPDRQQCRNFGRRQVTVTWVD